MKSILATIAIKRLYQAVSQHRESLRAANVVTFSSYDRHRLAWDRGTTKGRAHPPTAPLGELATVLPHCSPQRPHQRIRLSANSPVRSAKLRSPLLPTIRGSYVR